MNDSQLAERIAFEISWIINNQDDGDANSDSRHAEIARLNSAKALIVIIREIIKDELANHEISRTKN